MATKVICNAYYNKIRSFMTLSSLRNCAKQSLGNGISSLIWGKGIFLNNQWIVQSSWCLHGKKKI